MNKSRIKKNIILKFPDIFFLILFLILLVPKILDAQTKFDSTKIKIPISLLSNYIPTEVDPFKSEIN